MDSQKFDDLVRGLATGTSRRRVLKGMGGGVLAGALSLVGMRRGRAQELEDECLTKVGICHHSDKKAKFNYIEVCVDAVPAHAAHGDLVACPGAGFIDPETCTCFCPLEDADCTGQAVVDVDDCACVCPLTSTDCPGGVDAATCECISVCAGDPIGTACGGVAGCSCATETVTGAQVCITFEGGCSFPCATTADCAPGTICVDDNSCGFTHCHPPCSSGAFSLQALPTSHGE